MIAKVRSNFLGTAFGIYDHGVNPFKSGHGSAQIRREFGAVVYEPNLLGLKGPRKMTVVLPTMTRQGERIDVRPISEKDTLLERFKEKVNGRGVRDPERDVLMVQNKAPQWNEETQSYVLNFNGRVTLASVKNFQLVHDIDCEFIVFY